MAAERILIIDDEADVCTFFNRLLTRRGYQVVTATSEPQALQALQTGRFAAAMVDLKLPDTDGLTLLGHIKHAQPNCEVVIMTGFSTIKTAVQAIQLGAYEYLEKPFDDIGEIEALIARACSQGQRSRNGMASSADSWGPVAEQVGFFVGEAQSMTRLVTLAHKIAGKNINALIQGSTGSGKEVLARFIHAASNRAEQPFIAINCGALPENLLESELFGHEKGAFTGAGTIRRGIFELAHQGTLFLDEIGDASPSIQVKLLRVLETGEFTRIGGERPVKTDVRIISATNVDLEEAIRKKNFRDDLYYRLNVVRLEIPSLIERQSDIPTLAGFLIRQHAPDLQLSPATIEALTNYEWPGNIRELANVLRHAGALCDDGIIQPKHLPARLLNAPVPPPAPVQAATRQTAPVAAEAPAAENSPADHARHFWHHYAQESFLEQLDDGELNQLSLSLQGLEKKLQSVMRKKGLRPATTQMLKESEHEMIRKTLEENRWNITATAKALGIARNTLHRKIKLYGLDEA